MEIIKYYGSDTEKKEFIDHSEEPLMAVIAHDGTKAVVSLLDEGCEHHILLANALDAQELMGHADIHLTRQTYTDIRSTRKKQTAQKLNDFDFF